MASINTAAYKQNLANIFYKMASIKYMKQFEKDIKKVEKEMKRYLFSTQR